MSATATRSRRRADQNNKQSESEGLQLTREQAAERLEMLLSEDPQSEIGLSRRLGINHLNPSAKNQLVSNAMQVLDARHKAKRVPYRGKTGWVRYDSKHEALLAHPQEATFPPFELLRLADMFVPDYQRPLTTFAQRIRRRFRIELFGTLIVSDRGPRNKPKRYALIDGQTRWKAATDIGLITVPCVVFTGLSFQEEAKMFAQLQKERKNVTSWFRFRADLFAEEPEALAIRELVNQAGYELGDGVGQLKAVAALESCFKSDAYLLERTLVDLKAAWPDYVPEGVHIRGLHFLFRHFPMNVKSKDTIDDDRLVRRLMAAGPGKVARKADATKESGTVGRSGGTDKWMAYGFQAVYLGT